MKNGRGMHTSQSVPILFRPASSFSSEEKDVNTSSDDFDEDYNANTSYHRHHHQQHHLPPHSHDEEDPSSSAFTREDSVGTGMYTHSTAPTVDSSDSEELVYQCQMNMNPPLPPSPHVAPYGMKKSSHSSRIRDSSKYHKKSKGYRSSSSRINRNRPPTKMTRKRKRDVSTSVERWTNNFFPLNFMQTVRNYLLAVWMFGIISMFFLNTYAPDHITADVVIPLNNLHPSHVIPTHTSNAHIHKSSIVDKSTPIFSFFSTPHTPHNYIPLPPPENKVSVVLMNFSRPRMIRESSLMRTLVDHPSVGEILLLHANPKTAFNFVHPKVVNIDASKENDQMGLSLRFYFCQLVKNEWVLHLDDDMEFTPRALSEMLNEFSKDTHRIVGRYGRNRKEKSFFNGYSSKNTHKSSEVILTKLMVMERDICSAFFEHAHLIWEDTILNSGEGPLWNGEDIFMSLVANHVYGSDKLNYAMDWLDVWSAPDSLKDYGHGIQDISGGFSGLRFWDWHWWHSILRRNRHYTYRGTLWKTAKERLSGSGILMHR